MINPTSQPRALFNEHGFLATVKISERGGGFLPKMTVARRIFGDEPRKEKRKKSWLKKVSR
jgi:hypothetical protein